MPDDPRRLRHSVYSPNGLREYLTYKADVDRRVAEGHLTEAEGFILTSVRMQGIALESGSGQAIRHPTCERCGARVPVIGSETQRFRCSCSPELEQAVADRVRAGKRKAP